MLADTKAFCKDVPMASPDRKRLAAFVVNRRVQVGYKDRRQLAAAARLTDRTVGKIENGQSVSMASYAAIEPALEWEPGSMAAVLEGGEPIIRGQKPRPAPSRPEYDDPLMQQAYEALERVAGLDEGTRRDMVEFAEYRRGRARRAG
jgi:hypothetical protein